MTERIYGLDRKMIVTAPAYFSFSQCQTTEEAGSIARYYVLRNIKDPEIVVLTDGLEKKMEFDAGNVMTHVVNG